MRLQQFSQRLNCQRRQLARGLATSFLSKRRHPLQWLRYRTFLRSLRSFAACQHAREHSPHSLGGCGNERFCALRSNALRFALRSALARLLPLLICLPLLLAHVPLARAATTTILYAATRGTTPSSQGWTTALKSPLSSGPQASETAPDPQSGSPAVTLDSSTNNDDGIQAGYGRSDQTLDRSRGYTLRFDLQLVTEDHSNSKAQKNKTIDSLADRAGFSLIALSSDSRGIELGFWTTDLSTTQRIWAQNDGAVEPSTSVPTGTLFTHGEGAAFTTTQLTRYDLVVQGDRYRLYSGGVFTSTPVLSGTLRDYRANPNTPPFPDPYETPNFIFLGDDTSSARASFRLAQVELTDAALDQLPPPQVSSISRLGPSPTASDQVQFQVVFSAPVSGVDSSDFALVASGITAASIGSVSGGPITYTVTVNTGSGDGTLRLDLRDDDSILGADNQPLGGSGRGNGDYLPGPEVILRRTPSPTLLPLVLR